MNSLTSRPGTEPEAFTTGEPMIRLRNLEKCFQTKAGFTYVLRQINLDLAEGDFVSIIGPSGAGKSTLLGVLGLYDHVWEGEYHLLDHPVHRLSPKERATLNKRYVGFVFQQFHLLDDLTVAENLDLPLSYRNIPKSERQGAVADVLDRFGIVGKKDLFPSQLSGGQQQLVAVARAIIAKPKLILADEPTGNLHTDQGREIMELFKKLNQQGTTVVQVTHNEAWAAYGRQIIRLKDGWMEK
jgi:putative ABC transport system ATP-binding protein